MRNKKPFAIMFGIILVTGIIIFSNFDSARATSNDEANKDITKVTEICDNGVDDNGDGKVDDNCPPVPEDRNHTRVIIAGDLMADRFGDSIANGIKDRKPNLFVGIGDLGYADDLKWYISSFSSLGDRAKCVIGNHDAEEESDSNPVVQKTVDTCGISWHFKIANGTSLMLGFNTNGDLNKQDNLNKQLDITKKVLSNNTLMNGVKSIYILTHKPCFTHPDSDHPVGESDAVKVPPFCNSLADLLPQGVNITYVSGHNHEIASTSDGPKLADGVKFVSGGGGRHSHQECGWDNDWKRCNIVDGFLEFRINNNDGSAIWKFLHANGQVIHLCENGEDDKGDSKVDDSCPPEED